jgi:hypothetical protein
MPRRVLLLKETPSLGDAVQELLEAIGDHVEPARSSEEAALQAQSSSRFDLVISACNRRPSGLLRLLGTVPSAPTRRLPVVVVGSPLEEGGTPPSWPVHTVSLPLVPDTFISLLDRVAPGPAPEPPSQPGSLLRSN